MIESMFEMINIFGKVLFNKNELSNRINLTPTQFEIIFLLHKSGTITSSEISKVLRINKSNLSSQIDSLFEQKLLKRENDPSDRRKIYLSLTNEGWNIIKGLFTVSSEIALEKMPDIDNKEIKKITDNAKEISEIFKNRIIDIIDLELYNN